MLSQSETLLPWTLGYGNLQLTVEVSNIEQIKSEAGSTYITENRPICGIGRLIVRNSPHLKYLTNKKAKTVLCSVIKHAIACEQALYSGGQRELFSLRAPKARVSANEVKASEASPR